MFSGKTHTQGYTGTDFLLTGVVICVMLTEAIHLYGVYGGASVTQCVRLLGGLFAAAALSGLVICAVQRLKSRETMLSAVSKAQTGQAAVYIGFAALILFLVEFIILQVDNNIYTDGDMTIETVNTFIATDEFYSVEPLTGAAYTQGLPSRIKILCLPSLYTFLTIIFNMSSTVIVWRAVPAFVLICTAAAYKSLADAIFLDGHGNQSDYTKRNLFMMLVFVVFLLGDYMYGMDGFLLLESGFRGVSVRNLILLPYMVSLILRKKRLHAALCIIAEACITWTLYGAGVCLFAAVGLTVAEYFYNFVQRKKDDGTYSGKGESHV